MTLAQSTVILMDKPVDKQALHQHLLDKTALNVEAADTKHNLNTSMCMYARSFWLCAHYHRNYAETLIPQIESSPKSKP